MPSMTWQNKILLCQQISDQNQKQKILKDVWDLTFKLHK